MKISIIGGGGRVGSDAAFALQMSGAVRELVLVDANPDVAEGEALDLLQGTAYTGNQKIYSGPVEDVENSDCVIITAGLRRKPDESRLELINRNIDLFRLLLNDLKRARLSSKTKLLVVSNPVDILTEVAVQSGILPETKIIGLGTVLDTLRFRSLLGYNFEVNPRNIDALILGEHGDSMVPIWSSANINGVPLKSLPGYTEQRAKDVFEQTRKSGAEVIRLKGGAGRAVGIAIRTVVEAFATDRESVLPVSTFQKGTLGIKDVCLSLPTIVGPSGIVKVLDPHVNDSERRGLIESADSLRKILTRIAV